MNIAEQLSKEQKQQLNKLVKEKHLSRKDWEEIMGIHIYDIQ